jgi:hypothetical protein
MIWSSRESIRNKILSAALILEIKVIFLKKLHPLRLSSGELGLGGKVTKYIVVDIYHKMGAVKIVPPGLKSMNNGKEFLFMGGVVSFCRIYLMRGEGHWSGKSISVYLEEDRANSKANALVSMVEGRSGSKMRNTGAKLMVVLSAIKANLVDSFQTN